MKDPAKILEIASCGMFWTPSPRIYYSEVDLGPTSASHHNAIYVVKT